MRSTATSSLKVLRRLMNIDENWWQYIVPLIFQQILTTKQHQLYYHLITSWETSKLPLILRRLAFSSNLKTWNIVPIFPASKTTTYLLSSPETCRPPGATFRLSELVSEAQSCTKRRTNRVKRLVLVTPALAIVWIILLRLYYISISSRLLAV